MPRYIDVDKLYKSEIERCHCVPLVGSCTNDNKSLRDVLDNAPTADVIPRSEIDELNKICRETEQKCIEAAIEMIDQAKQEVASDIFDKLLSHTSVGIRLIKELINEEENSNVKKCLMGRFNELLGMEKVIAELEKKYIGDGQ